MTYSEATQRELDKYTRKLVRSMPAWIKKLFQEGKLFFEMTEEGLIALACKREVPTGKRTKAAAHVYNYMDHNPCEAFQVLEIQ